MTLWWIGNAVLALVIVPVVVMILNRVLEPALHIQQYADDITEHVTLFGPHLDSLQQLGRTRELVREINVDLERYVRALDQIP